MLFIGLTGGIASGKSTVARRLAEHGAVVIDADALSREALEPNSPLLKDVRATFGDDVFDGDVINRRALGDRVFSDATARETLEAMVHPYVRQRFDALMQKAVEENPDVVIVYDVPLLLERANEHPYDLIVTTVAGEKVQKQRLIEQRGFSPESAQLRIDAQASDVDRIERADVTIDTSGSLSTTMAEVDAFWAQAVAPRLRT